MKYVHEFLKHFSKVPAFSTKDAEQFLIYIGSGKKYPKRFIQNMRVGNRIFKLAKGMYTTQNNSEVIGFAFSPFYYGLTYALSYYNVWEERANPAIVTTKIVRSGTRKAMGINISVFRIPKTMFFGYNMIKGEAVYYPISDPEKTFIDLVYFGISLREDTLNRLVARLDRKKLREYLLRSPKRLWDSTEKIYYSATHRKI
jgi:predicted transcriptional regulator of viral defense system